MGNPNSLRMGKMVPEIIKPPGNPLNKLVGGSSQPARGPTKSPRINSVLGWSSKFAGSRSRNKTPDFEVHPSISPRHSTPREVCDSNRDFAWPVYKSIKPEGFHGFMEKLPTSSGGKFILGVRKKIMQRVSKKMCLFGAICLKNLDRLHLFLDSLYKPGTWNIHA